MNASNRGMRIPVSRRQHAGRRKQVEVPHHFGRDMIWNRPRFNRARIERPFMRCCRHLHAIVGASSVPNSSFDNPCRFAGQQVAPVLTYWSGLQHSCPASDTECRKLDTDLEQLNWWDR